VSFNALCLSQVEFPLAGWDLSQYVEADAGTHLYNCYAISNHLGNKLAKGHYTACVQMPVNTTNGPGWYLFSDESVKPMESPPGKVRLEHRGQSAVGNYLSVCKPASCSWKYVHRAGLGRSQSQWIGQVVTSALADIQSTAVPPPRVSAGLLDAGLHTVLHTVW
jgi:hypothetical protein